MICLHARQSAANLSTRREATQAVPSAAKQTKAFSRAARRFRGAFAVLAEVSGRHFESFFLILYHSEVGKNVLSVCYIITTTYSLPPNLLNHYKYIITIALYMSHKLIIFFLPVFYFQVFLCFFVFSLYILELRNTRVGSVVCQFIISIFDIPGAI